MFEVSQMVTVIISSVVTGRVRRKRFASHDKVVSYLRDLFSGQPKGRKRKGWRIEVVKT